MNIFVVAAALCVIGCSDQHKTAYVGMKVTNLSPYAITANYSLVTSAGRLDQKGSIVIPSMWNYTSGEPQPDPEKEFEWFVWEANENQNYTTRLSIGNDHSKIEAYFTANLIDHTKADHKCDLYDDMDDVHACMSVSAVRTQFQVAFPFISLAYMQSFNFSCTSAGTYENAPLGRTAIANCCAGYCSG